MIIQLDASHIIGYSDEHPVDEDDGSLVEKTLRKAGATSVEWTDEGISIEFKKIQEASVRAAIEQIRKDGCGEAMGSYFRTMVELTDD